MDTLVTLTCYLYDLEYPKFSVRGKPFGAIAYGTTDGGRETLLDIAGTLQVDLDMVAPPSCLYYRLRDGQERSEGGWMDINQRAVGENLVRHIAAMRTVSADLNGWKLREPR